MCMLPFPSKKVVCLTIMLSKLIFYQKPPCTIIVETVWRFSPLTIGWLALKQALMKGQITSLKIIEAGGKTEYFGKIANRISVNADYFNESEEAEKGVNSIQLVKVNGKWLINSITGILKKRDSPFQKSIFYNDKYSASYNS